MFKKRLLIPFMVILALFLTACGTDNANNKQDPVNNEDASGVVDDDYANFKITPERAFEIYLEKHPDTKVKKMQVEKSMGNYLYKVEGFDEMREYEIEIHPLTGDVTKDHSETDDDMDSMEIMKAQVGKVEAIVDKAIADAGEGALLHEWTLEMDDGIAELEVEIDQKGLGKIEYTYNVETGQIIEMDD